MSDYGRALPPTVAPESMRILFLHHGPVSGVAESLSAAWRQEGVDELHAIDLTAGMLDPLAAKLVTLPIALARGGVSVLRLGSGRYKDAVVSSRWFDAHQCRLIAGLGERDFDCAVCLGTTIPGWKLNRPYFLYCDHPILANLYFPDGQRRVRHWQSRLPHEREIIRKASLIFVMSGHGGRSFREHYHVPPEKVIWAGAGSNAPVAKESPPDRYERQNVLFVGVAWQRKGGPELVAAFSEIRKQLPKATLTIIGCSPNVSAPGVQVVGPVPQEVVADYMAKATIFCMPSRREPFGIVYIEAMHVGLPVVGSDLGATSDFIEEGRNGFRVPPGDVGKLADVLRSLLSDPEKCRQLGQYGRELVAPQYSWAKTQQRIAQAIRSQLGD